MGATLITLGGKGSPLSDVVQRAMAENQGELSIRSLRAPGFRALSPLLDKAQVQIDTAVVEVGLQRLALVADLLAEGLTYPITDPLSMTQLEWNQISKQQAAQRTMTPSARGENKLPIVLPTRLPIYLTTDRFELDLRTLLVSKRSGLPLDTALIKMATRGVNEALEDAAINGATTIDGQDLQDAGYKAPGILNDAHVNTQALTLASWDSTPVGTSIVDEVIAMAGKNIADNKTGPFNLYVPTGVGNAIQNDYSAAKGDLTIQQRIEQLQYGGRGIRVRTVDLMPSTKVALVQMSNDVIDLVTGQMPTPITWTSIDGFTIYNLVMAIMVPRIKSDYEGQSGICVGTIA